MTAKRTAAASAAMTTTTTKDAWWRTGVIYENHLPSFRVENSDGTGDLYGQNQSLDYLADTLGIDAFWVGLSESRRIGWMAQDNGVRLIPHSWNTAVGLAADLQLAAALPGTDLVEYMAGSAHIDPLPRDRFTLDSEGMFSIPDTPGLGLALDFDAVSRYTGGQRLLDV